MEKEHLMTDAATEGDPLINPYGVREGNESSFDPLTGGKPEDAVMDRNRRNAANKTSRNTKA